MDKSTPFKTFDELNTAFKGEYHTSPRYPQDHRVGELTTKSFPSLPRCMITALELGDRVLMEGPLNPEKPAYVVWKIDANCVHFQRPYITTTDFASGGGSSPADHYRQIIVYTGIEHFKVELTSNLVWVVFERYPIG